MSVDFSRELDRRGSHSMKWDVRENELPMWVADMDFQTAPEIVAAMRRRLDEGIYGYTVVPEEWTDAICGWWKRRHRFEIQPDWLIFCTGVVPAISSIIRKMTTVGENVLVQTPVYNIFFNSILNNGRKVLESRLHYDGSTYRIDFDDLEIKLADPQTTLMLLCNPHNPVGRVWDRDTQAKIGELCARHHVLVVSDEIHCDLTDPAHPYVPFASASETCASLSITCMAPTKAFNLAGLQTAAVMVPDPVLRHKVNRGLNTDEVAEPNVFATTACIAAFNEGEAWLEQMLAYVAENRRIAEEALSADAPDVRAIPAEATYLLWIDCGRIAEDTEALCEFLRARTGLILSEGGIYGGDGSRFVRMNLACPRARLMDGLERLTRGLALWKAQGLSGISGV